MRADVEDAFLASTELNAGFESGIVPLAPVPVVRKRESSIELERSIAPYMLACRTWPAKAMLQGAVSASGDRPARKMAERTVP